MVLVSVGLASLTQFDLTEDDHKALLDAMKINCVLHIAQTQRNLMRMINGDMAMNWKVNPLTAVSTYLRKAEGPSQNNS